MTGRSLEDVQRLLTSAIETYVEDACREAPADRDRLLNRKAPWSVRASHALRFFMSMVLRPRDRGEGQAGYRLPCPA